MRQVRIKLTSALVCLIAAGLLTVNGTPPAKSSQGNLSGESAVQRKSDPERQKREKSLLAQFMRAKLTASNQVLEGLCTEDFSLISKGAKNLKKLSSAERWRVSNDVMFRQHSAEFRTDVDKLLKAAEKKRIDSAALAWTKTTLNCIECHRWVRAMVIADAPRLDDSPLVGRR